MDKNNVGADLPKEICAKYQNNRHALIEILHDVQEELGYIPEALVPEIADQLNVTRAHINGVISFYEDFKTAPIANTHLKICRGEACQSMGADALIEQANQLTAQSQGKISSEPVYCLGNCALAPAMMAGEKLIGLLDEKSLSKIIKKAGQ
ncbi:MAG: NAD(P)H-dependent oxidoreductase subunit E [Devosiaceae bacterium]|nr:NAD(P)H-dependent oxidoreductase subunit E [Devosiaceae bacterium]